MSWAGGGGRLRGRQRHGAEAGGSLLARTAVARSATARRLRHPRSRQRGPRHHRAARAGASGRARAAQSGKAPRRGAERQPLWPRSVPPLPPMWKPSLATGPAMILDGGPCPLGLESTVVGVAGDAVTLLRLGGLPRQGIEAVLGRPLIDVQPCAPIISPGQTKSHYAPRTPLRLDVTQAAGRRGAARLRARRARVCRTHDQSQPARRS